MKLRYPALILAAALAAALAQTPPPAPAPGSGQTNVSDAENRTSFWDCAVPGGNFTTELSRITSVSIHEFNITAGKAVEVTIGTTGSVCARFYFIEPVTVGGALSAANAVKERVTEAAEKITDRTGTDKVWKKVTKDYPLATHAHTVEYRLQTREEVSAIHASAKTAWTTGKGRNIRVTEPPAK